MFLEDLFNFIKKTKKLLKDDSKLNQSMRKLYNLEDERRTDPVTKELLSELRIVKRILTTFMKKASPTDLLIARKLNYNIINGNIGSIIDELGSNITIKTRESRTELKEFTSTYFDNSSSISDLYNTFQPLFKEKTEKEIKEENIGILEAVFDDNVNIQNFSDAKKQFSEWTQMLDGYSRVLGIAKEDFEIIDISKNSPTSIQIKTTITNAIFVLTIVAGIYKAQSNVIEQKRKLVYIKKISEDSNVNDQSEYLQFVELLEEKIKNSFKKDISELIDSQLLKNKDNYPKEDKNEIRSALKLSIDKQVKFLDNGGNIELIKNTGKGFDNELKEIEAAKSMLIKSQSKTKKLDK